MTAPQPKPYEFKFKPILREEAVSKKPADQKSFTFKFVTYNILGQVYTKSVLFPYSPKGCLKWNHRSKAIQQLLLQLDADIFCFQELDEFPNFYHPFFEKNGYGSVYVQRPGKKRDGCAVVYKRNRFELVNFSSIDYNDLIPSLTNSQMQFLPFYNDDRVSPSIFVNGIERKEEEKKEVEPFTCSEIQNFCSQIPNSNLDSNNFDLKDPRIRYKRDCVSAIAALKLKECEEKCFIISSSHLYWNPACIDVKLAQAKYLIYSLTSFAKRFIPKFGTNLHFIIGGDFNSQPGDQVYNFLISKLNVDSLNTNANQSTESNEPKMSTQSTFTSENSTSKSHKDDGSDQCSLESMCLKSVYSFTGGEPSYTTHTEDFTGTLDYIFIASKTGLDVTSRIDIPELKDESIIGGVPNFYHPSDHMPLGVEIQTFPLLPNSN